jgi:hypothetical protein
MGRGICLEWDFSGEIPLGSFKIPTRHIAQIIDENAAQPTEKLEFRGPLKLGKVFVGFHEGILDQIGGADFSDELGGNLLIGHQEQILPARLKNFPPITFRTTSGRYAPILETILETIWVARTAAPVRCIMSPLHRDSAKLERGWSLLVANTLS